MKPLPIRERQSSFSKFVPQLRARFLVVAVVVESLSCVQLFDPIDGSTPSLLPCLSESARVCSNSYPLSRWCYPAIASSVTPFPSFLHCSGLGSIPGWGTNIPQAKWLDRKEGKNKTKPKNCCFKPLFWDNCYKAIGMHPTVVLAVRNLPANAGAVRRK